MAGIIMPIMGTVGQSAPRVDSLPAIQFWYDASSETYFNPTNPTNLADITQWNSKLPSGRNAGPVGGANKPQFMTAQAKNSLPALYFENTDNLSVSLSTLMNAIPGYTLFIVARPVQSTTGTAQKFVEMDNGEMGFGVDANGDYFYSVAGGTATGPSADANWHVHTLWFDGTRTGADRLRHRVEGSSQSITTSVNPGAVTLTDGTTADMDLARDTSGSEYLKGYIAEVMLCTSSLSIGQIIATENYLKNKWIDSSQTFYDPPGYVSSGLVAYYDPANSSSYSGTGTTLTDLSGNGINGTIVGATYTDNSYFTLDGVNDYIVTGNCFSAISASDTHTVEMWVYADATSDCLWSDLGTTNDPATSTYHFAGSQILQVGPFQQIITGLWNGTAITRDVGGSGTLTGAWKHVVRTYDGTTLRSYVNSVNGGGGTAMTFDSPGDDAYSTWFLAFGAQDTTTYSGSTAGFLSGKVGIMRVYNRALSGAEVTSNYNNAKSFYGL